MFTSIFMLNLQPTSYSFLSATRPEQVESIFSKVIDGLKAVDNCLQMHGSGGSDFILSDFSLAECLTAPFVVRMLDNFKHHRNVDLLEICDHMGLDHAKKWMIATRGRKVPMLLCKMYAVNPL